MPSMVVGISVARARGVDGHRRRQKRRSDGSIQATGYVLKPNCPSRVVVERLGERWTRLVLIALRSGPVRFTALREMIGVVTRKF